VLPPSAELVRHVERHPGKKTRQLAEQWSVTEDDFKDFVELILRLQLEGSLLRVPDLGWDIPERTGFRVGVLQVARGGQGFVRVALGSIKEDDIYVRPDNIHGAHDGDTVLLRVAKPGRLRERLREGTVVDVVRRSRRLIRGRMTEMSLTSSSRSSRRAKGSARSGRDGSGGGDSEGKGSRRAGGLVKPTDWRFPAEIYVPPSQFGGARDGENVLVRLLDEAPHGQNPQGKVVVCLSQEGSLDTDLLTIKETYELPGELPRAVLREAEAIEGTRNGSAWPERMDLRGLQVFTIDPSNAEDFDDAISLEHLPSGAQRLGVHIADVSHYVEAGTQLDREAERRGTSIYLPGQVIPMLPERLSNDLCSLRPGEDRLTKTVRMTFSSSGELTKTEVFRSVIHSQRRFTYDEVLAILEHVGGNKASDSLPPDHVAFEKTLHSMALLRDRMLSDRIERGALQLDIPKLRLLLDEAGNVEGLGQDSRDASHSLIEAFMLSANEAVASYFVSKKLPLVARVHPLPDEEKLKDFKSFVEALGLRFAGRGGSHELQELIKQVEGEPFSPVVQLGMLRTMGHAEYTSGAGLHFALATNFYCHFTSPIRRYPDLLVHRALDDHFDGLMAKATHRREWDSRLPHAAESASKLERRAEEAEREMTTLRLIRYLQGLVGQEMEACIVSIHPFGFFVRDEETLVEGLIHVATLGDDYYEFDPEKLTLEGRRKRRRFAVGDRLRVELAEADAEARQISFRLVGNKQKI